MPARVSIDMSRTVEFHGAGMLLLSTSEHCAPSPSSVKVTATVHEQNTLLHHVRPLFQPSVAVIYHPRCVPNGGKKTSFVRKIFLARCGAVAEALLLDHLPASGPTTPSSQSLLPAEAMLLGVQLHTARPANRSLVSSNTFPPHSKELLLRCDALYKSHSPGEMPPVLFPNSTALHYGAAVPERQVCASPKHDLSGGFGIFSQFLFFSPHLYLTSL